MEVSERYGEDKDVAHLDDQDELYHITQDPYEPEKHRSKYVFCLANNGGLR